MIRGSQIQTYSGDYVFPLFPYRWKPRIDDIAHALSLLNRFTGHTRVAYSVAEHSCRVAELVHETRPDLVLEALLHDASEAYLGDVASPLKQHPSFGEAYREAERALQGRIYRTFGCDGHEDPEVKRADLILLATEKRDLLGPGPDWALLRDVEPLPSTIRPWSAGKAELEFLRHYGAFRLAEAA